MTSTNLRGKCFEQAWLALMIMKTHMGRSQNGGGGYVGVYRGYVGIMEKNMEATFLGLGFRVVSGMWVPFWYP